MRRRQINDCLTRAIGSKLAYNFWYERPNLKVFDQLFKNYGNSPLYQLKTVYYAEVKEM